MRVTSVMNHRTTIERSDRASDTGGGYTEAWAPVVESTRCRVWSVSAQEVVASGRPESINTRLVLVPSGTDVRVGDRLVSITNRQGRVLFDGPLSVDGISERPDHLQLTTNRVT